MRILVVSNNYPSSNAPTYGIFVYNLVQKFVELGHEVTVISMKNILGIPKGKGKKISYGEERATVYYPKSISVSNKWILGYNTHLIGETFGVYSLKKFVKNNELKFDIIYAHFLVNGIKAVKALSNTGKPIFVAEGELKNINLRKSYYNPKVYLSLISKIRGFIAVSPQIKDNLIEVGVNSDKIIIKPNAVDLTHFYPRNQNEMRKKHGLPIDKKLVIFVGRFVEDKGPLRVLQAIEHMNDVEILFIGKGPQVLESDKIAFKDKVTTSLVPEFLCAADVFVLPTLHEGSCNAIIEAMACGLPIVSSDIPEIRFQCDPASSILVDPMNVKEISTAIGQILENPSKRQKMGKAAVAYAKNFEITKRAEDILNYIKTNSYFHEQ
ncbi:glycosyltransferase [uncultured Maribacter sp.]|uniref:glycosyltransferase n=1 Tax=uncultured Maribacter sp. TaxID=431308 RepID=UPI0030EF1966|tara:strand:+ start:43228 stop:44370 length:1143 start_codon:yes stop_codon:yes gene_type:complete